MRVTPRVQEATRRRILEAARKLFSAKGFDPTTTRDLSRAAGIAAGTLFNYFPAKEALALAIISEEIERAHADFGRRPGADSLEEDLFALAASEMRRLRPARKLLAAVLDAAWSPAARAPDEADADLRARHLERVAAIAARHGVPPLSALALQLYATLYTGVLAFWIEDASRGEEDSLALLDQSLRMYADWLTSQPERPDSAPAPETKTTAARGS